MNKFILILLCSTQMLLAPTIQPNEIVTLPNKNHIYSILTIYVGSWSTTTLNETAQEIAGKN